MDSAGASKIGPTNTKRVVWEKLEEKVGYISFFGHFHDNALAGFPRTKFKLKVFKPLDVSEDVKKEVVAQEFPSEVVPKIVAENVLEKVVAKNAPAEVIYEKTVSGDVVHAHDTAGEAAADAQKYVTEDATAINDVEQKQELEIQSEKEPAEKSPAEINSDEKAIENVPHTANEHEGGDGIPSSSDIYPIEKGIAFEKGLLFRDAWISAGMSEADFDKKLCFANEFTSDAALADIQNTVDEMEAAEKAQQKLSSVSTGKKLATIERLPLPEYEDDHQKIAAVEKIAEHADTVFGKADHETMIREQTPAKQIASELSCSFAMDDSPSIFDQSTHADSSLLVPDDSWFPRTPMTANTSILDEGKPSEERRGSNEAGDESFARINESCGDIDLELPPLPRRDNDIAPEQPHHPSWSPLHASSSDAAGPSSGPQKRSRSPSPTRDAPSEVEHEGPEMSGKSPGAKLRRLQKDASFIDDAQVGLLAALPKASAKRRVVDLEDSVDSFDDEGDIISAKRVKTSPRDEQVLERDPPPSHNTKNASKPRSEWSALKRYQSTANNSLPDYGPDLPASENTEPSQKSESMRGRHGAQGSFRPVNRLSSNESKTPSDAAQKLTPMKPYDFYGSSYKRPDNNTGKLSRPEGGFRATAGPKDEIEDSPPASRDSRHGGSSIRPGSDRDHLETRYDSVKSPRQLRGARGIQQSSALDSKAKNEKFMKHLKVKGQPPRSSASKSLMRSTTQSIDIQDLTDSDDASMDGPRVIIKGLPGSPFRSPTLRAPAHARGRTTTQSIELEDSIDDLSVGHYKKSTHTGPEKRKRVVKPLVENESGLAQIAHDTLSAQNKRRRVPEQSEKPETIHDTSDEEIRTLEKSNIKPTSFAASERAALNKPAAKKAASADKGPEKQTFKLLQVFSKSHPWFLGDSKQEWVLVHDISNGTLSIDGKDTISMSMTTGSISLIEYSEQCAMMTIMKSKDNTFGSSVHIHITLTGIDECDKLLSAISKNNPTVKRSQKSRDHMQNVFAHSRKTSVQTEKMRLNAEGRATISRAPQKPGAIANAKEPATRSRRVIDAFDAAGPVNASREPKKAPSMLRKNEPPVQTIFDLTGDDDEPKSASKGKSQSRVRDGSSASRRSSFDSQWTQLHPEWRESWKNSLVYPPSGKDRATINGEDIERLDEGEYLNDNLILFYMRWLWEHALESNPGLTKRVHLMNTFFYERLTTTPKGKRGFNYEAVERWTAKVDLLDYDYIVVPVCESEHWYLAIICNVKRFLGEDPSTRGAAQSQESSQKGPEKIVREPTMVKSDIVQNSSQGAISTGSQAGSPVKKGKKKQGPPVRKIDPDAPRIITLDSIGNRHSPTCTNLKEYLVAEIKSKRGIDIETPGAIGMTATNIPLQDNGWDCGLFLLNYLEKFLASPDEFIHNIVQNTPDFMERELPTALATRAKIRKILFELQAENFRSGINKMFDEPKESIEGSRAVSGQSNPSRPSASKSRSTTASKSPKQAVEQPTKEQSAESSTERGSRLGSLGAGEGAGIIDEPIAPIHRSVRDREVTPFPKGPTEDDDEASDTIEVKEDSIKVEPAQVTKTEANHEDAAESSPTGSNEGGSEAAAPTTEEFDGTKVSSGHNDQAAVDESTPYSSSESDEGKHRKHAHRDDDGDEMLLGAPHRPSPQLLSDPSFSSLSSAPSGGDGPSNTTGSKPGAPYALDGADHAFVRKGPKRVKH